MQIKFLAKASRQLVPMERQDDVPADALRTPGTQTAVGEYAVRGRRWIDCTGRMVMRSSGGKSRVNNAGDFICMKPGVLTMRNTTVARASRKNMIARPKQEPT